MFINIMGKFNIYLQTMQMRLFPVILLFLMLGFFHNPCLSQQGAGGRAAVETTNGLLAFQVGIPSEAMQAAIRNNMGNLGFGGAVAILSNPFSWGRHKRKSPLRIGGELGYTYYGRFLSEVNIGGYGGSYKTSYGILQMNAVLQLRPQQAETVSPFIEILAGGNFYLSHTKENLSVIESGLGIQGFDIDSYASVGFNRGIAVGCTIGRVSESNGRFTLRLSFNEGNDIKYVVRNSLKYDAGSGRLGYEIGKAPVRYFMVQVGVAI
jgi:hypothetical protein